MRLNYFFKRLMFTIAFLLSANIVMGQFVTKWTVGAGETITIPTKPGESYNYTVNWGDGPTNTSHTGTNPASGTMVADASHTYASAGTYTVTITPNTANDFPAIYFNNAGSKDKIVSIDSWGAGVWKGMENAFYGCVNLQVNTTASPNFAVNSSLKAMFKNCTTINADLSSWNTANVVNMASMFENATSFDQNIGAWNITGISGGDFGGNASMSNMFNGVILSTANYDSILIGWNSQVPSGNPPTNLVHFHGGGSKYCNGKTAKTELQGKSWIIDDGNENCNTPNMFITKWQTTSNNQTITIPTKAGETYNYTVDWGDNSTPTSHSNDTPPTHTYAALGTYTVRITPNVANGFPAIRFDNGGDKVKILTVEQWGTGQWNGMERAFYGCINLNVNATDAPNFAPNSNLSYMFAYCFAMTGNASMSSWDTSNVVNMEHMFFYDYNFNQDIGGWDVSNVTNMGSMFAYASAFNQDISNWNVSNVTNMTNMFLSAALSTANYDALLDKWSGLATLQTGVSFHGGGSKYCNKEVRDRLLSRGWTITDSGTSCPQITTLSPVKNSTNNVGNTNLVITFSSVVTKTATTDNITIRNTSDDSVVQTIAINSTDVTVSNSVVTINPPADLSNGSYYVLIPSGAFKNGSNYNFSGIAYKTTWNFTVQTNINEFTGTGSDWNTATNWSRGNVPVTNENVLIPVGKSVVLSNYVATVNDLDLQGKLTIQKTASLTLNGNFIQTGGGKLITETDADTNNSGTFIVNGTVTSIDDGLEQKITLNSKKWHHIGYTSDVKLTTGTKTAGFLTKNDSEIAKGDATVNRLGFMKFINNISNDPNVYGGSYWFYPKNYSSSTDFIIRGRGYGVKPTTPGADFVGTGKYFNDDFNYPITEGNHPGNGKYNLVSNPYTAYVDIQAFLTANSSQLEKNKVAVYFWDHSQGANGAYVAVNLSQTNPATNYISPNQGFFVISKNKLGTLSFTKAMQSHQTTAPFYKPGPMPVGLEEVRPSIELNVVNGNLRGNTHIRYVDGTTKGLDVGYDAGVLNESSIVYTKLIHDYNNEKFAIQSLPKANYEEMVVPVGVKAKANTVLTISTKVDNLPNGVKVFLEDKKENTFTRLDSENSEYTITTTDDLNGIGRFFIHTTKQSALSIDKEDDTRGVSVYAKGNVLHITNLEQGLVELHNTLGQKVLNRKITVDNSKIVLPASMSTGVYIVRVETPTGRRLTKKIIIE